MREHLFFRLFPPPAFLTMPYAGLDISDDSIKCLCYEGMGKGRRIVSYGSEDLPAGLIEAGDVKDEKAFVATLAAFAKKHGLSRVKVSVPEEKAYLFQTDVPDLDQGDIERNIEFKLEENVPLAAQDAVFYFDILPGASDVPTPKTSVSVVPRTYIENYMHLLSQAGMTPVAFETAPKAIARAVIPRSSRDTALIVHFMSRKTGIYVVSGDVVCFASTAAGMGVDSAGGEPALDELTKEISRIYAYWVSHGTGHSIDGIVLVGKGAPMFESISSRIADAGSMPVRLADIWTNALDLESYIPPVNQKESLEYAVAAGLALDLSLAP